MDSSNTYSHDGHHRRRALRHMVRERKERHMQQRLAVVRNYVVTRTIAEIMLVHTTMAKNTADILAVLGDPLGADIMRDALTEMLSIVQRMPHTQEEMERVLAEHKRRSAEAYEKMQMDGDALQALLDALDSLTEE